MARQDKATAVDELTEHFRGSTAAMLTEYRGLTVAQLKQLRRSLGDTTSYVVVKNTLTKIAADRAGVQGLNDLLAGPSAIAFVTGDPVEAAKGLRNFAKDHPNLVIKGGYMDGAVLSAQEIGRLADLESREVLLSKIAGVMKASLTQAASLFQAPLAQTARLLGALQAKLEDESPAAAEPVAAADEPVADEPVADEPVADEPAADEPTADEPVADEPVADEPVAEAAEAPEAAETPETPETPEA